LSQNTSLIANFIQKTADKNVVDNSEIEKLETVEREAEKNKINSVSAEFSIDEIERKLSLVKVDGSKIVNITNNNDFKSLSTTVNTISTNVNNINTELNNINEAIVSIHNNYVLKQIYDKDMLDVWNRLSWHEI
jgi:predicted  nucleic acid-binding Zn-ribbon protein